MYPQLQKQIDDVFEQQQYPAAQSRSQFFVDKNHSEKAWSTRLHILLEFMFAHHNDK
jgi:hypothetical protein